MRFKGFNFLQIGKYQQPASPLSVKDTTYTGDDSDETYFSKLYDVTGLNFDLANKYINLYDDNLKTTGYNPTTGKAIKGANVQRMQLLWHQYGFHEQIPWVWAIGNGGSADKLDDKGNFVGDELFGHQSYRRTFHYMTPEQAAELNAKLKAAGKGWHFEPLVDGQTGRQYYKAVKDTDYLSSGTIGISSTEKGSKGTGNGNEERKESEGAPVTALKPITLDVTPKLSGNPTLETVIPKLDYLNTGKFTRSYSILPTLGNLSTFLFTSEAINASKRASEAMLVPLQLAPYVLTKVTDAYHTKKEADNIAANVRSQAYDMANLSSNIDANLLILSDASRQSALIEKQGADANSSLIAASTQASLQAATANNLNAVLTANTNDANLKAIFNKRVAGAALALAELANAARTFVNSNLLDISLQTTFNNLQLSNYLTRADLQMYTQMSAKVLEQLRTTVNNLQDIKSDVNADTRKALRDKLISMLTNTQQGINGKFGFNNTVLQELGLGTTTNINWDALLLIDEFRLYFNDIITPKINNVKEWATRTTNSISGAHLSVVTATPDQVSPSSAPVYAQRRALNKAYNNININYDPYVKYTKSGGRMPTYEEEKLTAAKSKNILDKQTLENLKEFKKHNLEEEKELNKRVKLIITKLSKEEEILLRSIFK